MIDRPAALALFALTSLLTVGCGGGSEDPASTTPTAPTTTAQESAGETVTPEPLPEGIAPNLAAGKAGGTELGEPHSAAGIRYRLPQHWQAVEPQSSMRMGEAVIPGATEAAAGELTVFYFGAGGGGGMEANLDRWAGQMELNAAPQRETLNLDGGLTVTWIDCVGTLKASTMGVGPTTDQSGYRLFGAVVEGPGGPWFFKATGPEATLATEREGFVALLKSIRPAAPTA